MRVLERHMMEILPLQVLWRPLEEAMMILSVLQLEVFPWLPVSHYLTCLHVHMLIPVYLYPFLSPLVTVQGL